MLVTRTRLVVVSAAVALALSACTSAATGGSTVAQNGNPASTQMAAPTTTQKVAQTPSAPPDFGTKEALADVKLGTLRLDAKLGTPSAEVAITNHSSKRSNYIVDLDLMSADGKTRLDAAMVSAVGLAPGETTRLTGQFMTTQKLPKGAKVSIVGIARLAA